MCELCCGGTREDQPVLAETTDARQDLTGKIISPTGEILDRRPDKKGIPAWMIIVSAVSGLIGAIICFEYSGGGEGIPPRKDTEDTWGPPSGVPLLLRRGGVTAAPLAPTIRGPQN